MFEADHLGRYNDHSKQLTLGLCQFESNCLIGLTTVLIEVIVNEKKSDDYFVDLPKGISRKQIMAAVERAASKAGLYISHIGGYSRKKYPNAVNWHFKRDAKEVGHPGCYILGCKIVILDNDPS